MLLQIGPVTIDTRPFSADTVGRETAADFAAHELLGRRRGREFVGVGDETLTVTGTIITIRPELDGSEELEQLHGAREAGAPIYVMRGDGAALGWFVVDAITERHEMLRRDGVGMVIRHEVRMTKVADTGQGSAQGRNFVDPGHALLNSLISLFG